ncbi:MAG: ice-binding family protein [Burkholderiales bacterium]|nr:ice-binding family protein [Burkholderiales bacterium]
MSNKLDAATICGWFMALLLSALLAGCGGGGSGIGSGIGDSGPAVLPGAAGTPGAATTNPTAISASPANNAINVPTSTSGSGAAPVVTGTLVTATFNETMNPLTITPVGTFTLKETISGTNVPGTVTMNAANTIATFTPTAAALLVNTKYTATVSTAAKNTIGTSMPNPVSWSFTTATALSTGQSNLDLGTAGPYALFAGAGINLAITGTPSRIVGDVGQVPAAACNGCNVLPALPETIVGVLHQNDAPAIQARADYEAAFVDASTRATNSCVLAAPADISAAQGACGANFSPGTPGPVYGPGLYRTASPIGFTGTITLDAGGNPDAVFIFQSDSAINPAVNSTVVLAGLAKAKNIWWIAGTASTINLGATFKGTVIASDGVTVGVGSTAGAPATVEGRVFSRNAGATVGEFTTITVPQ